MSNPAPRGWWAVLAAAAVACAAVMLLPDLLMIRERRFYRARLPEVAARWEYGGRYSLFTPDADIIFYPSRVAETARSGRPGDPHVLENKSARLKTADSLVFLFLGALTRLFGDVDRAWLA